MTNAEINAAISAWFEPKPEPLDWVIIDQPIPSAKGFWLHTNSGYERGDVSVTIPLDYFHSEDANARLLQHIVDHMTPYGTAVHIGVRHNDSYDGRSVYWLELPTAYDEDVFESVQEASSIKEAVVLAFLKFAGIAHKRDGGERA